MGYNATSLIFTHFERYKGGYIVALSLQGATNVAQCSPL